MSSAFLAGFDQFRRRRQEMKKTSLVLLLGVVAAATATIVYTSNNVEPLDSLTSGARYQPYADVFRRRCPLCDSSVYSYCSDKLFHDSCCCHNPNNPYDRLPYQCQFADCSFLHANSCQEHKLITACCCTSYLFRK